MTKLSCGPLWKENNKWEIVGLCYILSTTNPILGWANLPMVLCMIFAHGFGRDGFRSMVLDASACINMYCNIERNIMKNQVGSPGFGIHVKIFVYMCYDLTLFMLCVLEFICR